MRECPTKEGCCWNRRYAHRIIACLLCIVFQLMFSMQHLVAQHTTQIQADSNMAYIIEGKDDTTVWYMSAAILLDVHVLAKSSEPKQVRFITDRDSLQCELKPGEQFNFTVLLHGKGPCNTRIESSPLKNFRDSQPEIHDTIPFVLGPQNNLIFRLKLNEQDSIRLIFDSGAMGVSMTTESMNRWHIQKPDSNTLQLGKQLWLHQRIDPVNLAGEGDGMFGWDLFDGYIVEIDYDRSLFIVHSVLPHFGLGFESFKMHYVRNYFFIDGCIQVKHSRFCNRFLFDTGYQRSLMLDKDIITEQKIPINVMPFINKTAVHNSSGELIPLLTVRSENFYLGRLRLKNIPTHVLGGDNPSGYKTHFLGGEVLKRFHILLDFQQNIVYLKPNSLFHQPYREAK